VVLYEIYDDAAAFDAHKRTPHFAAFDSESVSFVSTKAVTLGQVDDGGTGG
jgi:quinol monooxygenase YgiN